MKRIDPELKALALGLARSGALNIAQIVEHTGVSRGSLAAWLAAEKISVPDEQERFARNYVEAYRGLINGKRP